MAETVTRISQGFSHERQKPFPKWQRRHGWPPMNMRRADPNTYYYVSGRRTTDGRFLGRLD